MTIIFSCLLLLFAALSCTTDTAGHAEKGPIIMPVNPNGDSELALLMRDMYDEGMVVKTKIQNGEMPELLLDFEKIHTAQATEPEKAASPAYKVHALSYLQAVDALKNADAGQLEKSYNKMVDACMNCHKALCPGPVVRIKKMYL
ncbi:MAG: hypothetical protein AAFZ15_18850 [Bacteroidota bacterium]